MWLIPSNLSPDFVSAPDSWASNEDFSALLDAKSVPSVMSRSKRLSSKTFWRGWNRVFWFRHLYGRTLSPSTHARLVDWWTSSWRDTHVRPSVTPGSEKAPMIRDTFTRILNGQSI